MAGTARGVHALSWTQVFFNDLPAAPGQLPCSGARFRWEGEAMPLETAGRGGVLMLQAPLGREELERHAAEAVRRRFRRPVTVTAPEEPIVSGSFVVEGATGRWPVVPVVAGPRRALYVFLGGLPPERELAVAAVEEPVAPRLPTGADPTALLCFTPGTRIRTARGDMPIEVLRPGDMIITRDAGPQPLRWVARRRVTGARLYACPELRPVRIRAGALGAGWPARDLLLSPRHRLLLGGAAARVLFATGEVLVEARALVDDRAVVVDHRVRETSYLQLLFDEHHVIWAEGLAVESFLPEAAALDALIPDQRSELARIAPEVLARPADPDDACRRILSPGEAALFLGADGERAAVA